ncbi:uncharacterized protein LOC133871932 isoform X5 [Alnus glutinosa]|uniref:uncharacterized protein LOC133871932 isoform X5 n=1 Tax=Alnus glutinosa TaxID=3517 RepID=UPI002D79B454|nr:uncharacterized protein LOC133871932 isoform X5 [Alnus glutinosa]
MVACPNYGKEGKKMKKKIFSTLPDAVVGQKNFTETNFFRKHPHLRSNNFHPNEVPAGPNTLLSVENSSLNHRTPAADEPPPPFTLLVFDEPPPSFSCSLSIHFRRCRTAEPSTEEGEIEGSGRVMFGSELQTANGYFQEKPPPGTVQALTASNPVTLSSDPSYDTMNYAIQESEGAQFDEAVMEQEKEIDPLDAFLPPPPKDKCSEELQRKINKFLDYKKYGKSFNAEVRNRKDYRNPDFLLHAVRYQDINQIGSCFSKDVFDPHGYDKSDYYDEIEADMRREELEKKKNNKVEFVSGGTQSGTVAPTPKVNMPIPGVSTAAATGLLSVPPAADTTTRDGRQNKKSKWMGIEEILCPLGARILFLQLGLMQHSYLLLMLAQGTWLLPKTVGSRRKKNLVKGRWIEDLEPRVNYHTTF